MAKKSDMEHVALVTGGHGFLGQHIVKHLHLYGANIKEIRVLDIVKYEQKLEFSATKPVKIFIGSITDRDAVSEACRGVDIVLHIASLIDWSLFPNHEALHNINVKGTENIINVCKEENVPYLIYCGSSGIFNGPEEVKAGTETSVQSPSKLYFEAYASSKGKAQTIALSANGDKLKNGKMFRTLAILPLPMYGELDYVAIPLSIRPFKGTTYPLIGRMTATLQYSYVGNTAMMFVKAAESFPKNPDIGGEFFFAPDDTPPATLPCIIKPFLDLVNSKASSTWYIPYWFIMFALFLLYCLLIIVRLFKRVNLPNLHFTLGSIAFLNTTFYVRYDKAKTLLGYTPLYSYDAAIKRSKEFYADVI